MSNGKGLKGQWGLNEPKIPASSVQAHNFQAAFKAEMKKANEALEFTAVHTEKAKHDAIANKRNSVCTAYQTALNKIDPSDESRAQADITKALNLVSSLSKEATKLQQDTKKSMDAWTKAEPEFADMLDDLEELEQWQNKSAPALRADYTAIREAATDKKYDAALDGSKVFAENIKPILVAHDKQKAAKEKYDEQFAKVGFELNRAVNATATDRTKQTKGELVKLDKDREAAVKENNYVCAVSVLDAIAPLLVTYGEAAAKDKAQEEYEQQRELLQPRIDEAKKLACPPNLKAQRDGMLSNEQSIDNCVWNEDYVAAKAEAIALFKVVDDYVHAVLAERKDKTKWKEDRLKTLNEIRTELHGVRDNATEDAKKAVESARETRKVFSEFEVRFNKAKAAVNGEIKKAKDFEEICAYAFDVGLAVAFAMATGPIGKAAEAAGTMYEIAFTVGNKVVEDGTSKLINPFDGAGLNAFQGGSGVNWESFCDTAITAFGKYADITGIFNKMDTALDKHIAWLTAIAPEALESHETTMDKIDTIAGAKGEVASMKPDAAAKFTPAATLAAELKKKSDRDIQQDIAIRWIAGLKDNEYDAIDDLDDYLIKIGVISDDGKSDSKLGVDVGTYTSPADQSIVARKAKLQVVEQLVGKTGRWDGGGQVSVGGQTYGAQFTGTEPPVGSPVDVVQYVTLKKTYADGCVKEITYTLVVRASGN